ncbi:hypothetical protein [Microbispora catharanthi]|uniref:hypothetical protein n=1 Tax=Microbispora catharanthi TaxID=1712871 RepID=UPI001F0F85AF|nr:hypothetical protein [Microbispora catharanthi]
MATEARDAVVGSDDQQTAHLDRRKEMRIRESAAKVIQRLEQARSVGNRSRGRELLDRLGNMLKSLPSEKFRHELRQYAEYSAWLSPPIKDGRIQIGRRR